MRIIVQTAHPAHVHFYKNFIWEMEDEGHSIKIIARDKDITTDLLNHYGFEYEIVAKKRDVSWLPFSPVEFVQHLYNGYQAAIDFKPDLLTSKGGFVTTHVGKLTGSSSIMFPNNEHASFSNQIAVPFASRICTDEYFWEDFGDKHVRISGYHELAYLHPNRFSPDPTVFDDLHVSPQDRFVLMRLVAWNAHHDRGNSGIDDIKSIIEEFESLDTKVLITTENARPSEIEKYCVNVPIHKIHDLMYYSNLYIGESATMASESAVLGVPAIYISTIRLGYLDELECKYGLAYNFSGPNRQKNGIEKGKQILTELDKSYFTNKRKKLLSQKEDITRVMIKQAKDVVEG